MPKYPMLIVCKSGIVGAHQDLHHRLPCKNMKSYRFQLQTADQLAHPNMFPSLFVNV